MLDEQKFPNSMKKIGPKRGGGDFDQPLNLLKRAREKLDKKPGVSVDGHRVSKKELGVIRLVNRFAETGDIKIFRKILVKYVHDGKGPEITYTAPPADVSEWTDNEVFDASMAWWDLCGGTDVPLEEESGK